MLCCDNNSVEDNSILSRHVVGFEDFCGMLWSLVTVASLGLVHFHFVSCTDEGLTPIHERTLAGRPGS